MKDIELLILAGKPIYGEQRFSEIFEAALQKGPFTEGELPQGYTQITVDKRPMFVIGDPAALYREIRRRTGFKKVLDFLPFEPEPPAKEPA